MKNVFLCLSFCVVLVGCDDEVKTTDCPIQFTSVRPSPSYSMMLNPVPPEHQCDYITARKNGQAWTVRATTAFVEQNDTLYVHGFGHDETLAFKFLFTGPGTYEITAEANSGYLKGNAYYYTTVGGDVLISSYLLARDATVEIVEYNEIEKLIKGNFEFWFNERSGSSTMRFEQGTFSVHLPD